MFKDICIAPNEKLSFEVIKKDSKKTIEPIEQFFDTRFKEISREMTRMLREHASTK